MPRRVQDIVPADRRSIRDVAPPRARGEAKDKDKTKDKEREIPINRIPEPLRRMPVTPPTPHPAPRRKNKRVWLLATLGAVIVIAVAGYVASTRFSRASFTVVPKVVPLSVNGTYVAELSPSTAALTYDVITLSGSASTTIPAVDGPMTSTKASGTVTMYNGYSSQTVRLIAGTRLSDASGRIYRLTSSIVIPGYTKPAASVIPGKIGAAIVADQAGQSYNIGAADAVSDFKVVAYAGSPKYDSIYGRVASAISGGFVGTKKIVNQKLVASTTALLDSSLVSSLVAQIKSSVPAGYTMYDGAYATAFSSPTVGGNDNGSAIVSGRATVYGFIFKNDDLVHAFSGSKADALFGSFAYSTPGLGSLQFSITNLKDFNAAKKTPLTIRVKGDLKLIGTIPVEELKRKLAGMSLSGTQDVLRAYSPVVESGTGELAPPWAKVPSDLSRISVNVQSQ